MASMASPSIHCYTGNNYTKKLSLLTVSSTSRIFAQQQQRQQQNSTDQAGVGRREFILRSSEIAVLGAIFQFSGKKPNYLGVQKNPPGLALCPATNNCVSTSENASDLNHYAPPWTRGFHLYDQGKMNMLGLCTFFRFHTGNYNPEGGRGSKNPVSREVAMQELLEVIKSTRPGNFTPRILENRDDYVRVEYESPILGFVDDVEFWFPPGKKSLVQYRSASRLGSFDFDANRKRIKELRLKLEKKGWASEDNL